MYWEFRKLISREIEIEQKGLVQDMKKKWMKRIGVPVVLIIYLAFFITIYAASGSVSVSVSASSVNVGDTVTANVSISSSASVEEATYTVSYDSGILEYAGCSATANGSSAGTVSFNAGSGGATVTFKAVAAGSANIVGSAKDAYTLEAEEVSISGSGSASVTVKGAGTSTPGTSTGGTSTPGSTATASSNADLKALEISAGTLTPAFSPGITEYTVTVPNSVDVLTVSATKADSNAEIGISGSKNLKVGENKRYVTVEAPDGTKKTYTITVIREAGETQTQDSETSTTDSEAVENEGLTVNILGVNYIINNDFTGVTLPEGFEESTCMYQGQEVKAAKGLVKDLVLVLLTDETGNSAFYIYDEAAESFYRYDNIETGTKIYTLIQPDASVQIPAGYGETTLELNGVQVRAWILESGENSDFYLVYAMNWDGEVGFYLYDSKEGTMQRFVSVAAETKPEEEESTLEDVQETESKNSLGFGFTVKLLIGMGILCAVLLVVIITLAVRVSELKKSEEDEDEFYKDLENSNEIETEKETEAETVHEEEGLEREKSPLTAEKKIEEPLRSKEEEEPDFIFEDLEDMEKTKEPDFTDDDDDFDFEDFNYEDDDKK
jgi:hypothetical protein